MPGWVLSSALAIVVVMGPGGYAVAPADVSWLILQGTLLFTGCLILANRPKDTVGRLLLAGGVGFASAWLLFPVALAAADRGNLALAGVIEALSNAAGTVWVPLLAAALVLFPNGAFPSPVWRPARFLLWTTVTLSLLAPLTNGGWGGDRSNAVHPVPWSDSLAGLGDALALGFFVAEGMVMLVAVIGVIVRFRSSKGVEKVQMKWLAYSGLLILVWVSIILIQTDRGAVSGWDAVIDSVIFATVPIAMALAIIRYGLYEIDRIISRTVGYTLVLIPLALVYVLGAIWLPTSLVGGEVPPFFVAGSTLAIIGLFNPLRNRILARVDRRFYRSRYDAQNVVDSFGESLRDEVQMEVIASGLLEVVTRTMQPTSVGIWLRT